MTISIITVTYNAAALLPRTLQSVARQSHTSIEHLIVDGGSTDDTLRIARQYEQSAAYAVSITSESDRGIYDAMNKGLARATGQYVLFLNAGDTLHDAQTLATVVLTAQQQTVLPAVVYGDTAITDAEGHFIRLRRLRPPKQMTWRSFRSGMLVCHQAFYALTSLARSENYDLSYRHSADVDWCIRVMKKAEQQSLPIANSNALLADFMDGGNTTQHHTASLRERFGVMRRHYGLPTTLAMHAWFVVRALFG